MSKEGRGSQTVTRSCMEQKTTAQHVVSGLGQQRGRMRGALSQHGTRFRPDFSKVRGNLVQRELCGSDIRGGHVQRVICGPKMHGGCFGGGGASSCRLPPVANAADTA
jgi:hypothetical protein